MQSVLKAIAELYSAVRRNQPFDLAAQIAFWSLLALFPFAIFVLTILGYLRIAGLESELFLFAGQVLPSDAVRLIQSTLGEVTHRQHGLLLWAALFAALWSASSGVRGLLVALNRAHDVEETRSFIHIKLLAIAITLATALLLAVAMAGFLIGPELGQTLWRWLGLGKFSHHLWHVIRWPIVLWALTALLAAVYYFLPNQKQRFRLVTLGSTVAVALWLGVSWLFRWYVSHVGSFTRTYGTLGAAVMLLVWLYLSGVAGILGGEINALGHRRSGQRRKRSD